MLRRVPEMESTMERYKKGVSMVAGGVALLTLVMVAGPAAFAWGCTFVAGGAGLGLILVGGAEIAASLPSKPEPRRVYDYMKDGA